MPIYDFTGISAGQELNNFEPLFVKTTVAGTNTIVGGSTAGTLSWVGGAGTPVTYYYETSLPAHSIKVTYAGSDGSGSMLPCCARIVDHNNMMFLRFFSTTNLQLGFLLNGTPIPDSNWTVTRGANDDIELIVGYGNQIQVKHNGVLQVFPSTGTTSKTIANYSGATKAGFCARSQAVANVITAADISGIAPPPEVTSINSGSPITAGQVGVASVSTGFTGLPVTITTNASGVTCSGIGGTTNAATFNVSDRVDGGLYPKSGTSVNFTFTNGAEADSIATTVVKKATETLVAISLPLFAVNTLAQAILAQTGRTVATGDEFYHTIYSDLVITADTDFSVTNAGSFELWLYVNAGGDAGKNYHYVVTITESGAVIITGTSKNHYLGFGIGLGFN